MNEEHLNSRSNTPYGMRKTTCAQRVSQQAGFTYIGLLFFLFVIALASAIAVQTTSLLARRTAEQELLALGREFSAAFRSYYESTPAGQRRYPVTLQDLLKDPRLPGIRRHLRRLYADPITGKETWGIIAAPEGGIMGVYSLAKDTPIKIGSFDADQKDFTDKSSYAEWQFYYAPFAPTSTPSSGFSTSVQQKK